MGRSNLVRVPICVVNYWIVSVARVQVLETATMVTAMAVPNGAHMGLMRPVSYWKSEPLSLPCTRCLTAYRRNICLPSTPYGTVATYGT
jgi:hypothetical protein